MGYRVRIILYFCLILGAMGNKTEWFEQWFDTSYYHLLYDHRNDEEAEFFMKNLLDHLDLQPGNKILDLPCGKGRHSVFLQSQGFKVVGADISANSIKEARRFENEDLHFSIHDMRQPLKGKYHAIFNLFTSIGYFEHEETNAIVLRNFKDALIRGGHLVIDFLNIELVKRMLVPEQVIIKNGIEFTVRRRLEKKFVIKEIDVLDKGQKRSYKEMVQALDMKRFALYAEQAGLKIREVFGDYNLSEFIPESSERLILVMQ